MDITTIQNLGIALGLGLLVGLQREWAAKKIAGIRTFPLITLFGALAGTLVRDAGGWVVAAGLLSVAAMIIWGNWAIATKKGKFDAGLTSEIAALVMFLVGVAVATGYRLPAVAVGGIVTVLLQWKRPLHQLVQMIGEDDIRAITRLALIALVILPVLPNRALDSFGVINPFRIWLMVVLIVGISLGAYIIARLYGSRGGAIAAGILGGLISSTATTVSYSRQVREGRTGEKVAALVIMIASTVVFLRVMLEIAVTARESISQMAPPLLAMMAIMSGFSGAIYLTARGDFVLPATDRPPSDFKIAVVFGVLYAVIVFALALAKRYFGDKGLFLIAGLSGLTDMDAITLSTAEIVRSGQLEASTGWRVILVGGMANLLFKALVTAGLGGVRFFVRTSILLGLSMAGGVLILIFWPD